VGYYIIEDLHNGIPITYPPPSKDTFLHREKTTARALTVELLSNAIYILPFILERYTQEEVESIEVYIDQNASGAFVNKWYEDWEASDWTTSSGKPVPDAEQWKKLIMLMKGMSQRFIFSSGHHSYRDLMHQEAEKELNRFRTMRMVKEKRKEMGI
jgi:hypothetical protein